MSNELQSEQVWRIDRYGNYPCRENEERTQLGSDESGTKWKHHGSKAIHGYQNQILNRNDSGNVSEERDKFTQGLTELTTDKKLVAVQV